MQLISPHLPKSSSPTSRPYREIYATPCKWLCLIRFLCPLSVPCPYRKLASGELHLVFLCCCFKRDKTSHHEELFSGYFEDIISFRSPSYPDMWSIGQAFLSYLRCEERGKTCLRPLSWLSDKLKLETSSLLGSVSGPFYHHSGWLSVSVPHGAITMAHIDQYPLTMPSSLCRSSKNAEWRTQE